MTSFRDHDFTDLKPFLNLVYQARFLDEKMAKLAKQNKGGSFHLPSAGHEIVGVMSGLCLTPFRDWALPYYRDRAVVIGLGASIAELIGSFLSRDVEHHSGGRMMPDHFSHKKLNIPCQSSCVGSQFLQAVGVAKGLRLKNKNDVVYVSGGDGSTSQGDFYEAVNFACLHKLGVIFVIQDNGWAISVPVEEQTPGGNIASLLKGYSDLFISEVDGCDYEQTRLALQKAVFRGREFLGPSLIVAKVPRLGAHSSSDDPLKYKNESIRDSEKSLDPIPRLEALLEQKGLITPIERQRIKEQAFDFIEQEALKAEQYPFPDKKEADQKIFKPFIINNPLQEDVSISTNQENVVIVDALNHTLHEEMAKDKGIVIFGQDVADGKGGVFGVTRGLSTKYGIERCFNSSLAESTIIGVAIGLSFVEAFKPVVEIQFADYMWTGANQLLNELPSLHYRANGEWCCPLVIRMPYGGYIQGGPYHSQTVETFLAHTQGLKIVIPSNAADAKRLLRSAIHDPNPVIFLEHKALYRQRVFCARSEPREDEPYLPLGKGKIVKQGKDLTVVSWGISVVMTFEVLQRLEEEGFSVELIDLRTIVPLDMPLILDSLKKTSKLLIVHEAGSFCGFGAEIMAQVMEHGFTYLDAPVKRLTGKGMPVPYCKDLEEAVLPQAKDIETAVRELLSY
ncbi:MAG: alpha-ketoacid dehydrogenase subunit alpha/beta [Rhabdochlamydiaceae bacterium]